MFRRTRGLVEELSGKPFHPRDQQESTWGIMLRFLGRPCEFGDDCAYPGLGWRCGHRGARLRGHRGGTMTEASERQYSTRRRGRPASTSSTRRHSRATAPRKRSDLAGPSREVVYIFEREGPRGGPFWLLILECGHSVCRTRRAAKDFTGLVHALFEPLERRLAPRHAQCHCCASGLERQDPWILIGLFGGGVP